MTLAERIRWIMRARGLTARELGRQAKIPDRHISVIFDRQKKIDESDDPDKEPVEAAPRTIKAIAKAGRVSPAWLAWGDGEPEAPSTPPLHFEPDPRYPGLRRAIINMHSVVDADLLVDAWETRMHSETDLPVERWEDQFLGSQKRRNRGRLIVAAGGEDPDPGGDDDVRDALQRQLLPAASPPTPELPDGTPAPPALPPANTAPQGKGAKGSGRGKR